MGPIDVSGITRAHLLAALYNVAHCPGGMAALAFRVGDMNINEAMQLVNEAEKVLPRGQEVYFDYVHGRVLKVRLNGYSLDPRLYDRDNGEGAAARVVSRLREQLSHAAKDPIVDF
jgi:hypothetical protein